MVGSCGSFCFMYEPCVSGVSEVSDVWFVLVLFLLLVISKEDSNESDCFI